MFIICYVQKSKIKKKNNILKKGKDLLRNVRLYFLFVSFFVFFFLIIPPAPWQGLNNAVALDFDYRQQMIYWTDVTTQGSMIRRMYINGSDVQVSGKAGGETQQ